MAESTGFEDLVKLTDREIQTLLREVDQKDLVVSLKGADGKVAKKVLTNMSERVRAFIQDQVACLGELHQSEIEEVKSRILQQVRQLSEQGQITWPPGQKRKAATAKPKLSKAYLTSKKQAKESLRRSPSQLTCGEIDALCCSLAEIARCQGILALEPLLPPAKGDGPATTEGEFLTSALRLAIDGVEPRLLREIMEPGMRSLLHEHEVKYLKMVEGIVSLQLADNPRVIQLKLAAIR